MFNNTKTVSEADKKGDFLPYKKGLYILTVNEWKEKETDDKVWKDTAFVPTGKKIPQLELQFSLMNIDGTMSIEDIAGGSTQKAQFRAWIDDSNLGWNKKEKCAKLGRQILAALLRQPVDGDISFDGGESLIGLQMQVYMGVKEVNGKEKNELLDITQAPIF